MENIYEGYYEKKREFLKKLYKAHDNIMICIDVSLKENNQALIIKNVQRLNGLTMHLLRTQDILLMQLNSAHVENVYYAQENSKLRDEAFLNVSSKVGRYAEAKKMLDELYESYK